VLCANSKPLLISLGDGTWFRADFHIRLLFSSGVKSTKEVWLAACAHCRGAVVQVTVHVIRQKNYIIEYVTNT